MAKVVLASWLRDFEGMAKVLEQVGGHTITTINIDDWSSDTPVELIRRADEAGADIFIVELAPFLTMYRKEFPGIPCMEEFFEFLESLKARVLIWTVCGPGELQEEGIREGQYSVVRKPATSKEILVAINQCLS